MSPDALRRSTPTTSRVSPWGSRGWDNKGAGEADSGKTGDPGTGSKTDPDPGTEGKNGGDDSARDAVTAAALTAHATKRHKEIVGAELGRLRKAGVELPRDAGLKDLVNLVTSLTATVNELQQAAEGGGGEGSAGADSKAKAGDAGTAKGDTVPRAEVNRIVKAKLEEQAKVYEAKLADATKAVEAMKFQLKAHVVTGELRKLAAVEGMAEQGVVDFVMNPLNDFPFDIEPGERPGQFRILDKADGSEAINPTTRDVYKLPEVIRELKARKDLSHLVVGKVAGGGGGGSNAQSGADKGAGTAGSGKGQDQGKPKTSLELFQSGIAKGELGPGTGQQLSK